jgi:hypothetical protein
MVMIIDFDVFRDSSCTLHDTNRFIIIPVMTLARFMVNKQKYHTHGESPSLTIHTTPRRDLPLP